MENSPTTPRDINVDISVDNNTNFKFFLDFFCLHYMGWIKPKIHLTLLSLSPCSVCRYVVMYGTSGLLAKLDQVDAPPHPKCIGREVSGACRLCILRINFITCTAAIIPFMYSFSGSCAASISAFSL